jgi:hypothetical protein
LANEKEVEGVLVCFLVDDSRELHFILVEVLVAPTPCVVLLVFVRAIASSLDALLDDLIGDGLEVVGPSDLREEVDEGCGQVHSVVAELGGLVVPWEDVLWMEEESEIVGKGKRRLTHVVVVPALAQCEESD